MPMLSSPFTRPRVVATVVGLGLFASACGGGSSTESGAAASSANGSDAASSSDGAPDASATAEANQGNLSTSDDVRDIEVLSVDDGTVATLRDAVAGDRPVLLWFWAPH